MHESIMYIARGVKCGEFIDSLYLIGSNSYTGLPSLSECELVVVGGGGIQWF